MKKCLHAILFFPSLFIVTFFSSLLFYTRTNELGIWFMVIVAFAFSYFIAAKLSDQKRSTFFATVTFLVSITLPYLLLGLYGNSEREVGYGAAAKTTLENFRSQAERAYYQNNYSYASVCENGPARLLFDDVKEGALKDKSTPQDSRGLLFQWLSPKQLPQAPSADMFATCNDDDSSYAVEVFLLSVGGYWCIDSAGFAGVRESSIATKTSCE